MRHCFKGVWLDRTWSGHSVLRDRRARDKYGIALIRKSLNLVLRLNQIHLVLRRPGSQILACQ
jgi:hypothetical protein